MKKNFYAIIFFLILIQTSASIKMHAQSPIPDDATLKKLTSGFQFVEGPAWMPEGYIIFSDIPANRVYKWTEDGGKEVYLTPSGNSNGLMADHNGKLLLCQHSGRAVARLEDDGSFTNLATHYDGKKLHSPNDLAIKSDGSIFFTDPPWGNNPAELSFHGVFRLSPTGDLQLLADDLQYPNGIVFSPDESKVYVSTSHYKNVYVYDVVDDSLFQNKQLFATLNGSEAADGMTVDEDGNLYVTGSVGIAIYSPAGDLLDEVAVPGQTTNLCWGDDDGKALYITSGGALYRLGVDPVSAVGTENQIADEFKLNQNFPNPFNPVTTISFYLKENADVSINLYDIKGEFVRSVTDKAYSSGTHKKRISAGNLPSGVYIVNVQAIQNGRLTFTKSQKITLMK